ncbi:MAG: thiamine pyrophosphate-dependent dehydrogenase E1 component subunit alpha [Gemmataceae bacterium]
MPMDSGSSSAHGGADLLNPEISSGTESLPLERCLEIYRIMVRTRAMEERMIKMSKSGQGHFWIGGPGQEAFNTVLGLQVKKGEGPDFDYLHLHYRDSATLVAMGMPIIEGIRQMAMRATDTHSLGRNFISHWAKREWNIVPVTSVIEVQYAIAPGTALVQKRLSKDSLTIVTGGDAGTSEGDFASCLIWTSRPRQELPVLIVVTNNGYGISTPACSQHGEKHIIDRGKGFGIPGEVVDGNDPIASWHAVSRGMEYCRKHRKPFMIEAMLSRLYGHSSSSGALRDSSQPCCIQLFEKKLLEGGYIDPVQIECVHDEARAEVEEAVNQVMQEPQPEPRDVEKFTYAPSEVDVVYPGDYTGLPRQ